MDRAEKIGLGIAVAGHALLFALLSARFFAVPVPTPVQQQPLEVSLVKDVALEAAAPKAAETPAPSIAPDIGAPEDAASPEPAAAAPEPEPAPPVEKPAPPRAKPAPPKPVEKPAPAPKPVAAKKPTPETKPKPEPAAKPEKATAKAAPDTSASKSRATATSKAAKPAADKGTGSDVAAKSKRPRGSLLGDDFLKGLSDKPSKSQSVAPVATKVGAQELANIGQSIKRQVQTCADQQHTPGPGAERILVTLNLRLNRDGSLAGRPKVVRHDGVDDENQRYVARVDDLAIATYVGCSPLHGLPDALYDVQNGWSNFSLRYKLPG